MEARAEEGGVSPLVAAGVFIVIRREIDPNGADEQHFIGRGRVMLVDKTSFFELEGRFFTQRANLDKAFVLPSSMSSSSKTIEDKGTVTAANSGSSDTRLEVLASIMNNDLGVNLHLAPPGTASPPLVFRLLRTSTIKSSCPANHR